jgi:hypothetical protein
VQGTALGAITLNEQFRLRQHIRVRKNGGLHAKPASHASHMGSIQVTRVAESSHFATRVVWLSPTPH